MMTNHGTIAAYLDKDAATLRNGFLFSGSVTLSNFGALNTAFKDLNRKTNLSSSVASYVAVLSNPREYLAALSQSVIATFNLEKMGSHGSGSTTLIWNTPQRLAAQFFCTSVLLPNGRVVMVPFNATRSMTYNPYDLNPTTYTVHSGSYPGGAAYVGGCLMRDGRVFMGPYNATKGRIFDYVNNTSSIPAPTWGGTGANQGPVLMPDGNIYICPRNALAASIYFPTIDSMSYVSRGFPTQVWQGAYMMGDGRIYHCPSSITASFAFDPNTYTYTKLGGTYPGGINPFAGCVLLPDGRIFNIPYASTKAYIYNPASDSVTTSSVTFPGSNAFLRGCLTSDGQVFMAPANQLRPWIWDPKTDTAWTASATDPAWHAGTFGYYGAVTLLDGRIFSTPFNAVAPRIFTVRKNEPPRIPDMVLNQLANTF